MIGYDYFYKNGFLWRENQDTIMPLSMPHHKLELLDSSALSMLKDKNALLIRWDENFDRYTESEWWHIIKSEKEDISSLPKKTRYMIRKAAKEYETILCPREVIISQGYDVYCKAYEKYITHERKFNEEEFILSIKALPLETEFWCVLEISTKEMIAFSENLVRDSACFYVTMWFEPMALKKFAGYLLFHEMNKYYLNVIDLKYVSDGARSISHQTNIHDFLQSKFGFRKAYSRLHVVYVPWLSWVVACLYPFREFLNKLPGSACNKISIVLEQERIHRDCKLLPEIK